MYKKILVIIACIFYQYNYCSMEQLIDFGRTVLKKRELYADRLNNAINTMSFQALVQEELTVKDDDTTIPLSKLPGYIPEEAHQIVGGLKNPKAYPCNTGYIFYGEPGTGKNTLVYAIAKEAQAYVIDHPASEFMDTYIGQGAAAVRRLFAIAEDLSKRAPVVIFIDEIDTIGNRGNVDSNEVTATFNQLLNSMNYIKGAHPIVVVAATNCEKRIDNSLRRTGRFNMVKIELPDIDDRRAILYHYGTQYGCRFNQDFYQKMAEQTDGFCCASLEGIFKQALYLANKRSIPKIAKNHVYEALEREQRLHAKNKEIDKARNDEAMFHQEAQKQHLAHSKYNLSLGAFNTALSIVTFLIHLCI